MRTRFAKRPRILLVQADAAFAATLRGDLQTGGYEVGQVASLGEACSMLKAGGAEPFDLVLTDTEPDPATCARSSGLPLVLTAERAPERPAGKRPSARGTVLVKPFSYGRLHAEVMRAIAEARHATKEARVPAPSAMEGTSVVAA